MQLRCLAWGATAALVLGLGASLGAEEPSAGPPDATRVIARGPEQLVDALDIALHAAWPDRGQPRPVAMIVDVSPNTAKARAKIEQALRALDARGRKAASWSIARLGNKFAAPVSSAAELCARLDGVLSEETQVTSTYAELTRSIKSLKPKGAVVVYLADWRFEDECGLEKLLKDLRRRGATLSVVGSEAAFERGWNDGVKEAGEDINNIRGWSDYLPGVGRSPFGKHSHKAPWHGGETAYPHFVYRFSWLHWDTTFSAFDWELARLDEEDPTDVLEGLPEMPDDPEEREKFLEDLRKRLKDQPEPSGEGAPFGERPPGLPPGFPWPPEGGEAPGGPPEPDDDLTNEEKNIRFPLPSAFGPYGLMRLAGETGGRYVLFSFNPKGRRKVKYEYKRCNLFPPDLRSRAAIQKGLKRNPWAAALLRSWHTLLDADSHVILIRPPVKSNLSSAQSIDRLPYGSTFTYLWENRGEYKQFVRMAPDVIAVVERALAPLDKALETEAPADPVLRRYEADALYFRHALRCVRFAIAEAVDASKDLPKDAWKRGDQKPGVVEEAYVRQGRNPERVRPTSAVPFDLATAQALLEERKQLLARFRGTPFGEQLALNEIDTMRPTWFTRTNRVPGTGLSPTESTDTKPKTGRVPAGGSGGGGPTTGK